ncbi:MAG: MFS transporter, partial [Pseudomonadota bacterium]|nr:MFS transporter [Pseudomonadota bacterium]
MNFGARLAVWWQVAVVYRDKRVLAITFLGISSGFPLGILGDPLTAWLQESGLSKTSIGLFSLVGLPYAFKFLWAPAFDR